MATGPGYDDFKNFNLRDEQGQQQVKWTTGGRLKSFFCGKCLFLYITILLTAFLILLITGVMKSSKTGEAMEEFQSQVQMKLSQAMNNECHSRPCPRHWINFNGSCYFFSTKQATWEDSQKYCSTRAARLLIVNDEAEQHFVTVETESRRFWIGLTDRNSNNVWHWVDDTPYNSTPTFWMPGEPNSLAESCAHLWKQGLWNDAPCSKKDYFICEK
ncbi:hepatic lectin-like isoform X2 [Mobula birostris]|uniref:hepatic lectin-like isoform X2 n=1 Tax=Mobula birostris TaxID=1983395 RepID=UPI003B28D9DE